MTLQARQEDVEDRNALGPLGEPSASDRDRDACFFIKRPDLSLHSEFQKHGVAYLLPQELLHEAHVLEMFRGHPHPNIVRYHGCRVRRSFVTGLVLDRHACSLEDYLGGEEEGGDGSGRCVELLQNQDSKKRFVDELESAVQHLHALGWAHNDIQPGNVLVAIRPGTGVANRDHDGSRAQGRPPGKAAVVIRPILIDFESARRVGEKLGTSRGRDGWIDCDRKDYRTSEVCHDVWALDRMHEWVDGYPFRDGQVDGNLPG
ncbi:kinase-like protein [Apiospora marii]|uniref:kinase-like protein n=1 Tax=Apiospora marii TaxID=335849 RepID=UPI00312DBC78